MKQLRQYIRKLILEADDDFLDMMGHAPEERTPVEEPEKKESGKTVGQALEEIKAKENASKDAQRQGMLKKMGMEFPKMVPGVGAIPTLIEFLNDERKIASDAAPGAIEGLLRDYPLLDTWDINRNLFKIVDNQLLEIWEDEYMKEEVANVTLETPISSLEDINDYITRKIANMTNGEVIMDIST